MVSLFTYFVAGGAVVLPSTEVEQNDSPETVVDQEATSVIEEAASAADSMEEGIVTFDGRQSLDETSP